MSSKRPGSAIGSAGAAEIGGRAGAAGGVVAEGWPASADEAADGDAGDDTLPAASAAGDVALDGVDAA